LFEGVQVRFKRHNLSVSILIKANIPEQPIAARKAKERLKQPVDLSLVTRSTLKA